MTEKRFFCIRGFMKSGTNWLGALLNRHPQVSSTGEFHYQELLQLLLNHATTLPLYENRELLDATLAGLRQLFRNGIIAANQADAAVVGDRTPHTICPLTLPEAKYISIIRDGRDVMVSRMFHLFNNPEVASLFQRNVRMRELLEQFRRDPWFFRQNPHLLLSVEEPVRITARWWREHLETDRRFAAENPQVAIRFVRYEGLHLRTSEVCDQLFGFLDVDPAMASPLDETTKPGFGEERPDNFFRKGIVGDWRNYFTETSQVWFEEEAGDELQHQGYLTQDRDWRLRPA